MPHYTFFSTVPPPPHLLKHCLHLLVSRHIITYNNNIFSIIMSHSNHEFPETCPLTCRTYNLLYFQLHSTTAFQAKKAQKPVELVVYHDHEDVYIFFTCQLLSPKERTTRHRHHHPRIIFTLIRLEFVIHIFRLSRLARQQHECFICAKKRQKIIKVFLSPPLSTLVSFSPIFSVA